MPLLLKSAPLIVLYDIPSATSEELELKHALDQELPIYP